MMTQVLARRLTVLSYVILAHFTPVTDTALSINALGSRRIDLSHLSQTLEPSSRDPGFCRSGDVLYQVGRVFRERCGRCLCQEGGVKACNRTETQEKCFKEYSQRLEYTCRQWSEDSCCCLKEGCDDYGRIIPLGKKVDNDPSRPCLSKMCQKETGRLLVRLRACRPSRCVNSVSLPGVCCRQCPTGANCRIPEIASSIDSPIPALLPYPQTKTILTEAGAVLCQCFLPGRDASCVLLNNDTADTTDSDTSEEPLSSFLSTPRSLAPDLPGSLDQTLPSLNLESFPGKTTSSGKVSKGLSIFGLPERQRLQGDLLQQQQQQQQQWSGIFQRPPKRLLRTLPFQVLSRDVSKSPARVGPQPLGIGSKSQAGMSTRNRAPSTDRGAGMDKVSLTDTAVSLSSFRRRPLRDGMQANFVSNMIGKLLEFGLNG